MRCFLAFPLTSAIRDYAVAVETALREKSGVRGKWVRPENLHLTVLFLGEQDEQILAEFVAALRAECAPMSCVSMDVGGIGLFGRPPRVLFLESHERVPGTFRTLALRVRDCAQRCAIPVPESVLRQEPVPHLTLARFRSPAEAGVLAKCGRHSRGAWEWETPPPLPPPPVPPTWDLTSLRLYSSVLQPDGPEYTLLDEFPLAQ